MNFDADINSITHPILCCVGDSVAGQPTQFVMERLIATANLDWRVISVEVHEDKLATAVAGMRAMNFAALRFFPSLARQAAELLCPESLECQFVRGITSAGSDAQGWRCWHHAGAAIQACVNRCGDWASAVIWLHGDAQNLRSFVVHCRENPPRSIIWTAGPGSAPEQIMERVRLHMVAEGTEDIVETLLTQQLSEAPESSTLILLGELTEIRLQTLASLAATQTCQLVAVVSGGGVKSRLKTNWQSDKLTVISEIELAVAQEAIDFQRWTGRESDLALLQDAYEEYTDF